MGENIEEKNAKDRGELCAENKRLRLDCGRMPGPTKVQVITTPGAAALRYLHSPEDLPRITADIQQVRKFSADGNETQISHITCYYGKEVIVQCSVFRGREYAIKVARAIIKALMGRLGKRRRAAANRAARKAAEPQEQQQEDLHTPPARRGEEKAGETAGGES